MLLYFAGLLSGMVIALLAAIVIGFGMILSDDWHTRRWQHEHDPHHVPMPDR